MDFSDLLKGVSKDLTKVQLVDTIRRIDSGSYLLNAVLSGSIFGGYPVGMITGLGGDPSTGKTFACLHALKLFLDADPDAKAIYLDTEAAITKEILIERGIDYKRVLILRPKTVEDLRILLAQVLDNYNKSKAKTPYALFLDSLGNLPSEKEVQDALEGKKVGDMSRARAVKSVFRIITLMLDEAQWPMLVTNHQYDNVGGYGPAKTLSGGSGLKYCCTCILSLTKTAEKEGKETVAAIINVALTKGRHAREGKVAQVKIYFDHRGWDRYYGLADLAVEAGLWEAASQGRYVTPEGTYFGKHIYKDPERFFTAEVLAAIDEVCKEKFKYGGGGSEAEDEGDDD